MAGNDWSKAELWAPGAIAAGLLVAAAIGGGYALLGSEPEPESKPAVAARPDPSPDSKLDRRPERKAKPKPLPARKPKLAPKPEPEPAPKAETKAAPEPEPEIELVKEPEIGVAKVLGTYGGPGKGTVFDVIESTDNNLAELFAEGMTTTVVPGEVVKSSLDAAVDRQRPSLHECAEQHAPVTGALEITIVVSTGRITTVAVGKDTVANPEFRKCVSDHIRKWTFDPGEVGETSFTELF